MSELVKASSSRVFLIEDTAGPARSPLYLGTGRATSMAFSQGTVTAVRKPSPEQYGQFKTIGTIRGAADLPTITIEQMMALAVSDLLRITNKGCESDLHIHWGECETPDDFDGGWQLVRILEDVLPTDFGTSDLGALDADDEAAIIETVPFSGQRVYDVKQLLAEEQAATQVTDPIIAVLICDSISCGACGIASDGCQVVFAVGAGVAGSPGLPTEVLFTDDGGATWTETSITSMALGDTATDAACVGINLAVTSNDGGAIHYAPLADILLGTETWISVTTGIAVGGEPNAIFSLGRTLTWVVGDGGHIYFTADITAGLTVQTDGSITSQNLSAIHAIDKDNAVAVGASNAVLRTSNGGDSWSLIVGPAVGITLNAIFMRTDLEWFVGTAGGELWYTSDGGASWTLKAFPGSGAGQVRDIQFSTKNVGYLAHDTAAPAGRILRTINGGNTWVVIPEDTGQTIPANDQITALAACDEDPNLVYGGGIADDASDGFLVKFS